MSARHFRPRRWESWNRGPSRRALSSHWRREHYTRDDVSGAFKHGFEAGQDWHRVQREGWEVARRIADERKREDDLLDVAEAAGVPPLDATAPVGDEIESWLAYRHEVMRAIREEDDSQD